jgi:hypothetical protein
MSMRAVAIDCCALGESALRREYPFFWGLFYGRW